jgi:hypothetical protein
MRREAPVRFLGGGGAVMRCCYPTRTKRNFYWLVKMARMLAQTVHPTSVTENCTSNLTRALSGTFQAAKII